MVLKDRIAVVTGGAKGLGRGICERFVAEGARVAVADIDPDTAQTLARQLGPAAFPCRVDMAEAASVDALVDEVERRLGPIDIFVNNAGVSYIVPFLECDNALWEKTLRINLTGTFFGCRAALRRMAPRKRGVILNMSSQSGKVGNTQYAAYCASKFGIIGLTQSLAFEFASDGIRVNALCPGVVFTSLWDGMIADYARKRGLRVEDVQPFLESKVPLGRLCAVEDVANAAVFLVSDAAAYITGQALNVSGGAVLH